MVLKLQRTTYERKLEARISIPETEFGTKVENFRHMLHDFQMFENYIASPTFNKLPQIEKEEFLSSYKNLLEEEMNVTLQEAKHYLDQKTIADLFFNIFGHLDPQSLKEKDDQWNITFGFRPSSMRKDSSTFL